MALLFINAEHLESVRSNLQGESLFWKKLNYGMKLHADAAMAAGPWSLVWHKAPANDARPGDFYSEGPYWWPDPKNPDGPFIRRDGEVWPGRFSAHWDCLLDFSRTTSLLAWAGVYQQNQAYIDKAAEHLTRWFVDPATRMNPNMDHAQAVRGICAGKCSGIIEMTPFFRLFHGISLLEYTSPKYAPLFDGIREWCRELMVWLQTSPLGAEEGRQHNNHATWWNSLLAMLAVFCGDSAVFQASCERYKCTLLPAQMAADGSFPEELARTRSMHYCFFNMSALTVLFETAWQQGVDLWSYTLPDGRGMKKAVEWLMPWFDNPFGWKWPQIDGILPDEQLSFQLAALRLDMEACTDINKKRRTNDPFSNRERHLGPLELLPGYQP